MLSYFIFALLIHGFSAGKVCISDNLKRCLHKNEVGIYSLFMTAGDPCFKYQGGRWCFVSPGVVHPCTCTQECGCQGNDFDPMASCPPPPPTEPNNANQSLKKECSADRQKYCPLSLDNTMCKYCGVDTSACFQAVCKRLLTQAEKETLVNKHNNLRAKIANGQQSGQPSASNMNKLVWSDELAKIAQRWADQCPLYHDQDRRTPDYRHQPGQNIAYSWSSVHRFDWGLQNKVQSWYDEQADFPAGNVAAFSPAGATGTIGHFTQLVWAETKHIGCGIMYHKDASKPQYPFKKTLICNYHPPGNYLGRPVYKMGPAGSACPHNVSKDGLCL